MKILLVDDDLVARGLSARLLRNYGYEVIEAGDGSEALEILSTVPIHFVISDWLMPKVNGLELCRRIRSAGRQHYTYIILCTAKDTKRDLIEGMEAGADDFLVKPISKEELRVRVRAGRRVVDLETGLAAKNHELASLNGELQQAYARIEEDLKAAGWMQANLLPSVSPCTLGVKSEWRFRPSRYVAGDTLNVFTLDQNHVGFYLLDVSGHGVPAAMLSVTLSMLLTPDQTHGSPLKRFDSASQTYVPVSPDETMADLNRRFQSRDDQYFTMIYGILNTQTLMLRFTQAGHPHPLLIRGAREMKTLGTGGSPVGILPGVKYDTVEMQLEPGDRLFLYSDGVSECNNPAGDMFGEERLLKYLTNARSKPLNDMVGGLETEIENWHGKAEFDDDVSVLALELAEKTI